MESRYLHSIHVYMGMVGEGQIGKCLESEAVFRNSVSSLSTLLVDFFVTKEFVVMTHFLYV